MTWSLLTDDSVLTWGDDGKLDGAPLTAVRDAEAEIEAVPVASVTPTGPWFERGTPEHAWLVLRERQPDAEVDGEPPEFPDLGDELPDGNRELREALQEADFDPVRHPRGRAGRFVRVFHRTSHEAAREIMRSGRMISKENTQEVFVSNRRHGQAAGYGEAIVELHVPREHLRLDDEFPDGEKHYAIHVQHIGLDNLGPRAQDEGDEERRDKRLLDFMREMEPNSLERMSNYDIERTRDGDWRIAADSGGATTHVTPESALERIQAIRRAPADERITNIETFAGIFDGFEHGGLRARVDNRWGSGVAGTILDDQGRYAGSFAREIDARRDGEIGVYHDSLTLTPENQGKGFGTAFFEHSLQEYRSKGVSHVRVTAAGKVGGYQWARRGFDFDLDRYGVLATQWWLGNSDAREGIATDAKFIRAFAVYDMRPGRWREDFGINRMRGGVPDEMWTDFTRRFPTRDQIRRYIHGDDHALDGTFQEPQEIAEYGREYRWKEEVDPASLGVEMWLGKRFMVGAAWRGQMNLG